MKYEKELLPLANISGSKKTKAKNHPKKKNKSKSMGKHLEDAKVNSKFEDKENKSIHENFLSDFDVDSEDVEIFDTKSNNSMLPAFISVIRASAEKKNVQQSDDRSKYENTHSEAFFDVLQDYQALDSVNEDEDFNDILKNIEEFQEFGTVRTQLEELKNIGSQLETPEPTFTRNKSDRIANYDIAVKDITKWTAQVKRNNESEQITLEATQRVVNTPVTSIIDTFKPLYDFDKEIEESLSIIETQNQEKDTTNFLKASDPIRKKLENQQAAQLKALLFQEHRRNKRIGRIKSKLWHKIHKKSEARMRDKLLERLEAKNPELAEQLRRDYEMKFARLRIQRRQHARKKWSQMALRFGGKNVQKVVTEQMQNEYDEKKRVERLAKRLPNDSDFSGSEDEMDSDEDETDLTTKESQSASNTVTKARLQTLRELKKSVEPLPEKGLFAMPFMKRALEKKRKEVNKAAEDLVNEIDEIKDIDIEKSFVENDEDDDFSASKKRKEKLSDKILKVKGKKLPVFSARELADANKTIEEKLEKNPEISTLNNLLFSSNFVTRNNKNSSSSSPDVATANENQYMSYSKGSNNEFLHPKQQRDEPLMSNVFGLLNQKERRNDSFLSTDSPKLEYKSFNLLGNICSSNDTQKCGDIPEKKILKTNPWINSSKRNSSVSSQKNGVKTKEKVKEDKNEDKGKKSNSLLENLKVNVEQRKMITEAFIPSTSVEDDFRNEVLREKEEKEKEDEEANNIMVGWGHWAGKDIIKKRRKINAKNSQDSNVFSNSNYTSVVFNSKLDRKAAKFLLKTAPAPFKDATEYETSIKHPIGPEWNVSAAHHRLIQPKVSVRIGAVVKPLCYTKNLSKREVDSLLEVWSENPNANKRNKAKL